jgi:cell filamentation protein
MNKYDYEYEWDSKYCYPNSYTLKNKLNIKDSNLLMEAERKIVAVKLYDAKVSPINGNFDVAHYLDVHKYLFEDIYDWAGKIRVVNISKGTSFCQAIHIDSYLENIFSKLKNEAFLKGLNKSYMVKNLAYYLGELNAVHPFREGNGRAQRLFLEYLAEMNGYYLDFSKCPSEDMIIASEKSINGDNSNLEGIVDKIISEIIEEGEPAL